MIITQGVFKKSLITQGINRNYSGPYAFDYYWYINNDMLLFNTERIYNSLEEEE